MKRPIKKYRGIYSIYEDGRVYSHIMKSMVRPRTINGEKYVMLAKNGRYRKHKVADLVKETFYEEKK